MSDITINREIADRFIKAMDSLTDCMAASYALHVEIKAAMMVCDFPLVDKPMPIPMKRGCQCYLSPNNVFVACAKCQSEHIELNKI